VRGEKVDVQNREVSNGILLRMISLRNAFKVKEEREGRRKVEERMYLLGTRNNNNKLAVNCSKPTRLFHFLVIGL
jgi:hypothetical protein